MPATRQRRRTARRAVATPVLAVAAIFATAVPAGAATTQSGNQAITGAPTPQLVATFPGSLALPALAAGTTVSSSEQTVNVKSNASWGLRISADSANMRRWNGTAYVAGSLASALEWAKTSQGGVPVGSPSYSALATSTANAVTGIGPTSDSGTDLGVSFRQPVSYADDAGIGSDSYRVLVTYAAGQGF